MLDGSPLVLRNTGTRNHWLGVSLTGSKSNRQGLGARVTVTDNSGKKQVFDVTTAGSYISANDPRILVGLGDAKGVRGRGALARRTRSNSHEPVDRSIYRY